MRKWGRSSEDAPHPGTLFIIVRIVACLGSTQLLLMHLGGMERLSLAYISPECPLL